jgi:hypothetical protein
VSASPIAAAEASRASIGKSSRSTAHFASSATPIKSTRTPTLTTVLPPNRNSRAAANARSKADGPRGGGRVRWAAGAISTRAASAAGGGVKVGASAAAAGAGGVTRTASRAACGASASARGARSSWSASSRRSSRASEPSITAARRAADRRPANSAPTAALESAAHPLSPNSPPSTAPSSPQPK